MRHFSLTALMLLVVVAASGKASDNIVKIDWRMYREGMMTIADDAGGSTVYSIYDNCPYKDASYISYNACFRRSDNRILIAPEPVPAPPLYSALMTIQQLVWKEIYDSDIMQIGAVPCTYYDLSDQFYLVNPDDEMLEMMKESVTAGMIEELSSREDAKLRVDVLIDSEGRVIEVEQRIDLKGSPLNISPEDWAGLAGYEREIKARVLYETLSHFDFYADKGFKYMIAVFQFEFKNGEIHLHRGKSIRECDADFFRENADRLRHCVHF